MENFYKDNADIQFHFKNMNLRGIVDLREDFAKKTDSEAPVSYEDALDNYDKVLDIVGEIAGDVVAPRAANVDIEGARWENGEVIYAEGTRIALDTLKKADLMGFTISREYGGLNMPKTIYTMAIEMISRADASLMNLFGLQEIAETIYRFGSEDQKKKHLPRFCSGEVTGAMALTEPDAGSDLQAVMLKAILQADGTWRLNGVKRFITNGCAQVSLVLARSEEGTTDGRGLSLFIYDRDNNMRIRRIEHKLGIHGSPTCEIQFKNAPAELLGKRKMGLIKYTMGLMNGARLGVSAQALGVAEAAMREACRYASERVQFKKTIQEFPPVAEMLSDMRVGVEAGRALLYETARIVDIKEGLDEKVEHSATNDPSTIEALKRYTKYASTFTPILKAYNTEMANKVCYDAIQVHGGVGYTTEFAVERLYRDARITNIYEGTTQLQVVAAIGGIMAGVVFERLNDFEGAHDFVPVAKLFEKARSLRAQLEVAVSFVKQKGDAYYQDYHARRLVDMTVLTIISYLFCMDALMEKSKEDVASCFLMKAMPQMKCMMDFVTSSEARTLGRE